MQAGEAAELSIVEQRGMTEWKWRFTDQRGRFEAEVEFDISGPEGQVLIERAFPSAAPSTGPDLRREVIRCLRSVIGEREAEAVATSPAPFLHVTGMRLSHLALTLPYELIFRPEEPGRVIRIVCPPFVVPPPAQLEEPDSMLAAFALRPEDNFLPLHHEAAAVEEVARRAGIDYDELFLACTAEDILAAAQPASILHLSGHGHAGVWRCQWRGKDESALTSSDLIQAFGQKTPHLFVLDFCESSSEAEALRVAEAAMTGMVALHDYSVTSLAVDKPAPSSSMAMDLAAALPTAVLALRTSADDTQARRFVEAFYRAFLVDRRPLEEAFAVAVADRGFYDDAGVPVPALFLSEAFAKADPYDRARSPRDGRVRALSHAQRWRLNAYYKAVGAFAVGFESRVFCSISGSIGDCRERLAETLDATIERWAEITGAAAPPDPVAEELTERNFFLRWNLSEADSGGALTGIDIETMPAEIALIELLSNRSGLSFPDLSLVGFATCDVPLTVEALPKARLGPLAERLRQIYEARAPEGDRSLRWTLASELIDHLPAEQARVIRRWSDDKWEKLRALGQLAVDLSAARFVLGDDGWLFESSAAAFDRIILRLDLSPDQVWATILQMIEAGIAVRGSDLLTERSPKQLTIDLLTASRAWAACSDEAVAALTEHHIGLQVRALGIGHDLAGAPTESLVSLANLCVGSGDPRAVELILELEGRSDGAAIAARLRAAADPSIATEVERRLAATQQDRWSEWRQLHDAGRAPEAAVVLAEISKDPKASDHPLRPELIQLGVSDLEPAESLRRVGDLERRLTEPMGGRPATDTEHELLLMARQIKARALDRLGERQAAAEALVETFNFACTAGAEPPQVVSAGSSAVAALADAGDVKRARATWEVIDGAVQSLHPGERKVVALEAQVGLLIREGRLLRARVVSEQLLDVIAAWSEPRAGVVRHALRTCAMGFNDLPESFALLALIRSREPQAREILPNEDQRLADAFGHLTLDQVLRAAADLGETLPLDALGLTAESYLAAAEALFASLAEMDPVSPAEVLLGPEALEALTARATAGCLMSETILSSLQPGAPDPPRPANAPSDASGLRRLATEHGRLSEILGHLLAENFKVALPVTAAAFTGSREARTIWAGLLIGDFHRNLNPTVTPALLQLGSGDLGGAQATLQPTADNVELLCNACIMIEACSLDADENREQTLEERLISFARSGWRIVFEQITANDEVGWAATKALSGSIARPAELMAAIGSAIEDGRSLRDFFAVTADEPVTGEVLDLIGAAPTYICLAIAASKAGAADAADSVLAALTRSSGSETCLEAAYSLLSLRIEQDENGLDRKREIEEAMDRVQELLGEVELAPASEVRHLAKISHAGIRTGRAKESLAATRASLRFPTEVMGFNHRYGLHFNHVQLSQALEDPKAAAEALLPAGQDLGFLLACVIFSRTKVEPRDPASLPYAATLSDLAEEAEVERLSPAMRDAAVELRRSMDEAAGWEKVARMLDRDLDDA
jgi:hypothetical protein